MERVTRFAFRNRAAIILVVLLALVLGGFSYLTMPKELLPSIDAPYITVSVLSPGSDARTMSDEVAVPIEQALATVQNKTTVTSTSGDGYTQVMVQFNSRTNMKDAKSAVEDALANVNMPSNAGKPIVSQLNTSQIPVADITLTFKDGINQSNLDIVKNHIIPMFQGIDGVMNVGVYGDNPVEANVTLNTKKLLQLHIPVQAVFGILQGQNIATAVGQETIDGKAASLTVVGKVDSVRSLGNLNVVPGVPLREVATIAVRAAQPTVTRVDGQPAVLLFVQKTDSANAVSIAKSIRSMAQTVNQQYGPEIHAKVPFSTADYVVNSVNSMMREVLMGALFATIVILLFLRNIRMTIVTVVSIPLSLGLTLFLLSEVGVTLNVLTLGAIAVAVGRLVDDSIVVIENIYRRTQLEGFSKDVVLSATREVGTAITASTLTTVAVFLPVGIVQSSLRTFLYSFALSVTFSLLSSLMVALTVVPLMSSRMLRGMKVKEHSKSKTMSRVLRWSLNHKWVVLPLTVLIFGASIAAYVSIPKAQIDTADTQDISVSLKYPADTPIDKVKANAYRLESYMMKQPQVKDVILIIGNNETQAQYGSLSSPTLADFTVIMKNGANADTFTSHVQAQKSSYPGADLSAFAAQGFSSSNTIDVDLYGSDAMALYKASKQVEAATRGIAGVQQVQSNQQDVTPRYVIHVNPALANPQQVAQQLQSLLNTVPLGNMTLNGKTLAVVLSPIVTPSNRAEIMQLPIALTSGSMGTSGPATIVPLSRVATISEVSQPSTILRKDGNEYVDVSIQVDPKQLGTVAKAVALKLKALHLPHGVTYSTGGAAASLGGDMTDLYKTMGIAIALVYLIMVITFKSLRTPLAILCTLPLAAVGSVLALLITRTNPDTTAVIGMLILAGIVVTNAIVLLDRVKQNEQRMSIRDAIVEASLTRLRPILMTAAATVFAMVPLLFSPPESGSIVSKSLAIVVIGGLTVSTLLTLIVIPTVYELFYWRSSRKQRRAEAKSRLQTEPAV
ncbi:MAG: efflux RND transporter permease subunit [Alicyclobacillus sp.]|nr:efflux RND transporter permease subunit [Alicyclobacillus sp.]